MRSAPNRTAVGIYRSGETMWVLGIGAPLLPPLFLTDLCRV